MAVYNNKHKQNSVKDKNRLACMWMLKSVGHQKPAYLLL